MTLGHESSGIVTSIGSSISSSEFKVGDKVALEVGQPCESCYDFCQAGRYNLCKEMKFRSSARNFPHTQGTLQERINHPAKWCYKLPQNMGLDLGAVLEPLSVAIHASKRAGELEGKTVLVMGAGAVGLLCAYAAKKKGAGKVVIADIDAGRVDFAIRERFVDGGYTVPLKRGGNIDEDLQIARGNAKSIMGMAVNGKPLGEVDVTFDCTGVPSCVQAAIYAARPGGKVMLIGMGTPVYTLPMSHAALREVDICGVFRYANTYSEGIELMSKFSEPDLQGLVTHRFHGLEAAADAFAMAAKTVDANGKLVLKVVIDMSSASRNGP